MYGCAAAAAVYIVYCNTNTTSPEQLLTTILSEKFFFLSYGKCINYPLVLMGDLHVAHIHFEKL